MEASPPLDCDANGAPLVLSCCPPCGVLRPYTGGYYVEATYWGIAVSDGWLHESDEEGETPLSRGLSCGYEPAVNLLLTISETPNPSDEEPIFQACRESRVSDVRSLLEDGTLIDESDGNGLTPLHWAAITGCMDLGKLLVNRGAHINPRDENTTDMTPTALARWLGYEELTEYLSKQGGLD